MAGIYPKELYMSGDELYRYLHISKKKMRYLLMNGFIPCIDTGKKTHRYIVLRAEVEKYIERRKNDPSVEEGSFFFCQTSCIGF